MGSYSQTGRPLVVKTPLPADLLLLVGFSGHEGISQLFSFQLDLIAENQREKEVAFDQLLGKKITVEMAQAGSKKRYFSGICNRVSQGSRDDVFTGFQMQLVPELWLLTRRAQSRVFQRLTVKAILQKVLEGLRVSFDGIDEQGTLGHPRDYCVQYRETDFNFACRLMEEEGICYFFKHDENGHQLVLANTPKGHSDVPELSKVAFAGAAQVGGPRTENLVYSWSREQTLRAGKVTLRDHCFELPANKKPPFFQDLQAQAPIQESVQAGKVTHKLKVPLAVQALGSNDKLELYDYPGEYAQRFDGVNQGGGDQSAELEKVFEDNKRTAEIRMQEEAAAGLLIQGTSDCPQFVSGHKFTLEKHYNADGAYVLTGVVHSASQQGYRSGEGSGVSYRNGFTCIPLGLPYRPPRVTAKPVVVGTQTAVVVGSGAANEEILVDKYGRVKVQFHWDRAGAHNAKPEQGTFKYSSCWVRVAQPWAGKNWGAFFWPRIGQEVVVAFLEGDPDQPIVVGSLYNADQRPPYLGDAKNPSPDPKHKNDPNLSGIKTNTTLGGKGFNELRFDDTKDKEQVFIHAERNHDLRVKASSMTSVGGSAHLTVGGEKDGKKTGDIKQRVFHDLHLHVGNDEIRFVEHDRHDTVKNNVIQEVTDGSRFSAVPKGDTVQQGKAIYVKSDTNLVLQGASIYISASSLIQLNVGGNLVLIDATGVTIFGTLTKINCPGSVALPLPPTPPVPPPGGKPTAGTNTLKPDDPAGADNAVSGSKSAP